MLVTPFSMLSVSIAICTLCSCPNTPPCSLPPPPPGTFEDDDVTHVEGDVNPVRDLDIISEELRLKDEQYLIKQIV